MNPRTSASLLDFQPIEDERALQNFAGLQALNSMGTRAAETITRDTRQFATFLVAPTFRVAGVNQRFERAETFVDITIPVLDIRPDAWVIVTLPDAWVVVTLPDAWVVVASARLATLALGLGLIQKIEIASSLPQWDARQNATEAIGEAYAVFEALMLGFWLEWMTRAAEEARFEFKTPENIPFKDFVHITNAEPQAKKPSWFGRLVGRKN